MLYIETPRELSVMLQQAAKAHHEYEVTTGAPDANWPDWYARWIFDVHAASTAPLAAQLATPFTISEY